MSFIKGTSSVALSGGSTGLTVSGSPVTTSGVMTIAGTLAVANGGTGVTTLAALATALSTPIGSLSAGTAISDTDKFVSDQSSGASDPVYITGLQFKTYVGGGTNVENNYTSGAILTTDDVAYCTNTSNASFSLANGTVGGKILRVKRYAAGTVALTLTLDGTSQTYNLVSSAVLETLTLRWSTAKTSWILV